MLLVLLILSTFFVGLLELLEFSLVGSSLAKLSSLYDDKPNFSYLIYLKNNAASIVLLLLLLTITINNGVLILFTKLLDNYRLSDITNSIIFIMFNILIVLISIVAKTVGIISPEKLLYSFCKPLYFLVYLLSPIQFIIVKLAHLIYSILGITKNRGNWIHLSYELQEMLIEFKKNGNVLPFEAIIAQNILTLSDLTAADIMISRRKITTAEYNNDLTKFIDKIVDIDEELILIWQHDEENIMGYINVQYILKDYIKNKKSNLRKKLDDYIYMPSYFHEHTNLSTILNKTLEQPNCLFLVVDEYETIIGVISKEIISEIILGSSETNMINILSPNKVIVDGLCNISFLNSRMAWELDEDHTTVAGLLMHEYKDIPETGEDVRVQNDYMFKVVDKKNGIIERILIYKELLSNVD